MKDNNLINIEDTKKDKETSERTIQYKKEISSRLKSIVKAINWMLSGAYGGKMLFGLIIYYPNSDGFSDYITNGEPDRTLEVLKQKVKDIETLKDKIEPMEG